MELPWRWGRRLLPWATWWQPTGGGRRRRTRWPRRSARGRRARAGRGRGRIPADSCRGGSRRTRRRTTAGGPGAAPGRGCSGGRPVRWAAATSPRRRGTWARRPRPSPPRGRPSLSCLWIGWSLLTLLLGWRLLLIGLGIISRAGSWLADASEFRPVACLSSFMSLPCTAYQPIFFSSIYWKSHFEVWTSKFRMRPHILVPDLSSFQNAPQDILY